MEDRGVASAQPLLPRAGSTVISQSGVYRTKTASRAECEAALIADPSVNPALQRFSTVKPVYTETFQSFQLSKNRVSVFDRRTFCSSEEKFSPVLSSD